MIGQVRTGKDAQETIQVVEQKAIADLGAGFLELGNKPLSGEKSVSKKLIQSFYGWVYANVTALAEEISKIDYELYKVTLVKGEPTLEEIKAHPILDLLDKPNEFTTASQFTYMLESYLELTGDAFILLDKPTMPTSMTLLQPDKVTLTLGNPMDGDFVVQNYIYTDTVDGKKMQVTYEPDVILHIKTPNPQNPYRGKSVVEAAATSIDTSNLAQEFLKIFFNNAAVPNFALTSDQRITDEDIKRIQKQFKSRYGGVSNAFKTLILGGGLKPITVQQTGQQMQMIELLSATRDEIMAMFKNTKASLGIVEDVNRANAEASLLGWKESVIRPKMNRITDTLNEELIPKFGVNLVLGFCDPVPDDDQGEIDKVQKLYSNAGKQVMSINEARELLDLPALPGSENDDVSQPVAYSPPTIDNPPAPLKHINLKRHFRRHKTYEWIETQQKIYAEAHDIAERVVKSKKKAVVKEAPVAELMPAPRDYQNFDYAAASDYWAKQIHITDAAEHKFDNAIAKFIDHLQTVTLDNLQHIVPKSAKSKTKAVNPFDEDLEVKSAIDLFTPLYADIARLAGGEADKLLPGKSSFLPSKNLTENISKAVELFATSFVKTDKDKLTAIISDGISNGQSVPQISNAIQEQFAQFSKNQSKVISRTETLRASNMGAYDAYKQSDVVEATQWFTARDNRVDEDCAELDGQIMDLGKDFFDSSYATGEQPPLHPNCRCVLLPVIVSTKQMTLEKEIADLKAEQEVAAKELAEKDQIITELEKIAEID